MSAVRSARVLRLVQVWESVEVGGGGSASPGMRFLEARVRASLA